MNAGETGGDVAAADAPDSDDDMGDHYDAGNSPQHRLVWKLSIKFVRMYDCD